MLTGLAAAISAFGAVAAAGVNYASTAATNAQNEDQWDRAFRYQQDQDKLNRDIHSQEFYESQDFAREQLREAERMQVAQWNRENEYNKPVNQVKRLLEAGLNPLGVPTLNAGNSGNVNVANPVSGPSPSPLINAPGPGLPHFQAPNLGSLPSDITSAINAAVNQKNAETNAKRVNAQNALDFQRVDEVKANTQAIKDGNIRNEDLFTFQLLEAQQNLANMKSDNTLKQATIQNIRVRSEHMLVQAQKVYSDMMSTAGQLELQRFGQEIQAAGLQVQAQKAKAEIASMSLDELIKYSDKFGILHTEGSSSTDSSSWNVAGKASGKLSLKGPSGELSVSGGYESGSSSTDSNGLVYRQIREETLKPMLAAMRCLDELVKNPENISLGYAVRNLSQYLNTSAAFAIKNFLLIQGQIKTLAPSAVNPSNSDTYSGNN